MDLKKLLRSYFTATPPTPEPEPSRERDGELPPVLREEARQIERRYGVQNISEEALGLFEPPAVGETNTTSGGTARGRDLPHEQQEREGHER